VVVALAYVPGRVVGMSARVEELTLMWRRDVAPLAALAVWVVLVWLTLGRPGMKPNRPPATPPSTG